MLAAISPVTEIEELPLVVSGRRVLEVSVGENLVVFANSADIVFRAGLSWRS